MGRIISLGVCVCLVVLLALPAGGEVKFKSEKGLITLNLKEADLRVVLRAFAKETGANLILGKGVRGKVTLILKDVPPETALDILLKAHYCGYEKEKGIIRVFSLLPPEEIEAAVQLENGRVAHTFWIDYIEVEELKITLDNLVPPDTQILTTKGSRALVVEGTPETIQKVAMLIRRLDPQPQQVMVEAKIIEVTNTGTSVLGMNWSITNPDNPTEVTTTKGFANLPSASAAEGLYYNVTRDNVEILLEALSTKTGYNLLSSPKVIATSGQKAEIITGQRLGYKVTTTTTTGMMESVEFLDVGTKLEFTPNIKGDGYILMSIHPEVSEGSIVNGLPQKTTTETTTNILIRDGETIIIGGLIKEKAQEVNRGVPILSEIPFFGIPFRRTEVETIKNEILVFITPHIISPQIIEEMKAPTQEIEKKRKEFKPSIFF